MDGAQRIRRLARHLGKRAMHRNAPPAFVLPRADVLVLGGDLAYPNPSEASDGGWGVVL